MKTVACTTAELRTATAEHTIAVVASVRVVALGITAHDSLALLVTGCTLATSALQSVTTALSIGLGLVLGTVRASAVASLLGIAVTSAGAADCVGGCELAAAAAVLVGIVTDGVALELAGLRVTALVVATPG